MCTREILGEKRTRNNWYYKSKSGASKSPETARENSLRLKAKFLAKGYLLTN